MDVTHTILLKKNSNLDQFAIGYRILYGMYLDQKYLKKTSTGTAFRKHKCFKKLKWVMAENIRRGLNSKTYKGKPTLDFNVSSVLCFKNHVKVPYFGEMQWEKDFPLSGKLRKASLLKKDGNWYIQLTFFIKDEILLTND